MDFASIVALHGANRWDGVSVLETEVDFAGWSTAQVAKLPALGERFRQWLAAFESQFQPTRLANSAGVSVPDACRRLGRQLDDGASLATLLQQTVQLLSATLGVDAAFGQSSVTDSPTRFRVLVRFEEESLARACLETARRMFLAARDSQPFDLAVELRKLIDQADDERLGPSSRAIVRAAEARGIPCRRLNSGSLVQYGEGRRLRRTWTAETDATSAIGESIAQDKSLTKRLLTAAGVPVPHGRSVADAEDAWAAAREIGFPVVVKPRNANHARGVSLNLSTREQVLAAYDWACKDGDTDKVMVEQYARGQQHRLLVVGNRLVAAARGESEFVVGDGRRTIRELVDDVNRDPRRGENYTDLLNVLKLDDAALIVLAKQGLAPDAIPNARQRVLIQHVGDLTTDCTDDVHPEVAARVELAARVVGLDVAGLDVVAIDISRPLEEQRGMILEVNAGPSLGMHIAPLHGRPRPVGEAIVAMLFAAGQTGRIPVTAVVGGGPRTRVAEALDARLREAGYAVGLSTAAGLHFVGRRYSDDAASDRDNLHAMLSHPLVDAVVLESRPEQVLKHGLGYCRCDLVVVAAITDDRELQAALAAVRATPATGCVVAPAELAATDPAAFEALRAACQGSFLAAPPLDGETDVDSRIARLVAQAAACTVNVD